MKKEKRGALGYIAKRAAHLCARFAPDKKPGQIVISLE